MRIYQGEGRESVLHTYCYWILGIDVHLLGHCELWVSRRDLFAFYLLVERTW